MVKNKPAFFNLLNSFSTFSTPGLRGPGNPFFPRLFGILGPKVPNDSCKGPGRLQSIVLCLHKDYDREGHSLFFHVNGKLKATMLMLVVLALEIIDLLLALDTTSIKVVILPTVFTLEWRTWCIQQSLVPCFCQGDSLVLRSVPLQLRDICQKSFRNPCP